jgi:succinoglycan biosynthesis transport protein ExoP
METPQELDIKSYIRLIYRKRYLFVAVMVLVTSLGIAAAYILPKKYEAKSIVFIQTDFLNAVMKGIAVTTPSVEDRTQALSVVMKSRPLILKVLQNIDLGPMRKSTAELESLVPAFAKKSVIELSSSNRRGMDMFTVSMTHSSPVIARDYVNTLVRLYIEENTTSSRESTYGANKFLSEQIVLLKEKMSAIDGAIVRLSQQKESVGQERLGELQKKLAELTRQYTENHPEVVKVKDEIDALKNQLAIRGGTTATDMNVKTQQQGVEAGLSVKQRLADLERDRETYKNMYAELMKAQGKLEVSSRMEGQDKEGIFHVFEPAILPQTPVSPKRVLIILFGIAAGIAAGIGLIILMDSSVKTIKNANSLSVFGLPVLAVITHLRTQEEIHKTRKKDVLLYIFTGFYYTGVAAVLAIELFAGGML